MSEEEKILTLDGYLKLLKELQAARRVIEAAEKLDVEHTVQKEACTLCKLEEALAAYKEAKADKGEG